MATDQSIAHDAFGHWLSGFTDGEGMFCLTRNAAKNRDVPIPNGKFEIHLRADDRAVLEIIQSFLGVGTFYERPQRIHGIDRGQAISRPQVCYRVQRAVDLQKVIIPHFARFPLRAKKANDFAIWRRGVDLLYRAASRKTRRRLDGYGTFPRWTKEELTEFDSLVSALKEQRKFETSGEILPPVPRVPKPNGWFD